MQALNPAAAPSHPEGIATPTPALWRRMSCWLYEGILLFGLIFIAGYLFDTLSQSRHALANRSLRMAFLFIVVGIYFGWFWSRGQTLAQKTWHIRVVDTGGNPVTQVRACWRYVCCWLWFLPPLAAYGAGVPVWSTLALLTLWICGYALASRLHPQRQFWHDVLAGTRLIHHKPSPRPHQMQA